MKNFVIFKNARTGSSNLAYAITQSPSAFCYPEILNDYSQSKSSISDHINQKLSNRKENDILGFSINPFKKPKLDVNFWNFPANNEKHVFLLTRDIFEQTISRCLSVLTSSWPANKTSKNAEEILALVQSGLTIDVSVFEQLLISNIKHKKGTEEFAKEFAKKNEVSSETLDYTKLYGENKSDLNKLNNILGLKLIEQNFNIENKLLPPDASTFINNFEELIKIKENMNDNILCSP